MHKVEREEAQTFRAYYNECSAGHNASRPNHKEFTMAVKATTTASVKPATVEVEAPVVLGPQGQQPAKYAPTTWVNGMRAIREAKGYGRIAMAEALGVKTAFYWNIETKFTEEELTKGKWLAKANALPVAPKKAKAVAAPVAKASPAKPKAPKAKPVDTTELI